MQATTVAGVLTSACVLAACGFTPPKPPSPKEYPRLAINKTDPRLAMNASTPGREPLEPTSSTASLVQGSLPSGPLLQSTDQPGSTSNLHQGQNATNPVSAPIAEPMLSSVTHSWHVSPKDGTVRQALQRWAHDAGWTFSTEHWELPWDVLIEASMDFQAESFEQAAKSLTNAVTLSASPLLPCFDPDKTLRIRPNTQSCDRAEPSPTSR